jgi:hypothetical protein
VTLYEPSKRFAHRIATMIGAGLISYKEYYPWADRLIEMLVDPPLWIIEIATLKDQNDAVVAINDFVYSEPFEAFDRGACDDEYLACLFLRYKHREFSWRTFLMEAGRFTDGSDSKLDCGYFYSRLDVLDEANFGRNVEREQVVDVEIQLSAGIAAVEPLYREFLTFSTSMHSEKSSTAS